MEDSLHIEDTKDLLQKFDYGVISFRTIVSDYQGTYMVGFLDKDGTIVVILDGYGSCSGCCWYQDGPHSPHACLKVIEGLKDSAVNRYATYVEMIADMEKPLWHTQFHGDENEIKAFRDDMIKFFS